MIVTRNGRAARIARLEASANASPLPPDLAELIHELSLDELRILAGSLKASIAGEPDHEDIEVAALIEKLKERDRRWTRVLTGWW